MTVEVRYIVMKAGKEIATFDNKKAAELFDKNLDIAADLEKFLAKGKFSLDSEQQEKLAFFLAEHSLEVVQILKGAGIKKQLSGSAKSQSAETEKAVGVKKSAEK